MRMSRFLVFRKAVSMIKKHKKNGKALDIGCAYGFLADYLTQKGFPAMGCDISEYALNIASKMFPNIETFKADIDNGTILPKEEYDLITAFEILEHCKNFEEISAKVSDALISGGLFLISVPDSDIVPPEEQGDDTHVSFLNEQEWIETFSKNGMRCIEKSFYPWFLKKLKPYWGTNLILFQKD